MGLKCRGAALAVSRSLTDFIKIRDVAIEFEMQGAGDPVLLVH